ncbi:phage virion morphogenesis (putative tail completion) protein [Modicisalibacter muralis]|uniref:Phage virion morphogenesis (Putative tail completion) protein n=1 Tax=Modicisalibacter muralis TaxID=119000 RepID=A0A1G9EQN3_9GAMM|nr:phage virion morphogenesis protein [Halomonas muralis]SDK78502.1 phage virion morphogenesis (putative tail completion) protein [Halomonas muralis]
MDDLDALEEWAAPLIARLEPRQRRALTRRVALDLRRAQRERIKAQQNPDGTPFEPRKPQHRAQQGAIRRKAMFSKIRTAKYLKAKGNGDTAEVGFVGRVARIARVHQKGLRARVDRDGPMYDYPARRLVGFSAADRELIRDSLIDHLATL